MPALNAPPVSPALPSAEMPAAQERSRGYWTSALLRFRRDPVAMGAAVMVLLLIMLAIVGPWITPADPYAASMLKRLKPIGTEGFPLGTDELGRDMLSRLMAGARLSLFIGITPVVLAFLAGSVIGILAGYAGGMANTAIMRTVDVFYAFPSVLLAIALSGVLGAGLVNSLTSLTIVFIPQIVRVAESVTTQVRARDYVEAARASGASPFTIVRVHVLGNVLGPIFVYATSLIAVSLILASGLSFLGLGIKAPDTSLGTLLNAGQSVVQTSPWVLIFPSVVLVVLTFSVQLIGDGLRDAIDPYSRSGGKAE